MVLPTVPTGVVVGVGVGVGVSVVDSGAGSLLVVAAAVETTMDEVLVDASGVDDGVEDGVEDSDAGSEELAVGGFSHRALAAGRTSLMATSAPHAAITSAVAAAWMAAWFAAVQAQA